MRIEIWTVYESLSDNWLHLRISTPDGNYYNFRVPEATNGKQGEYSFDYPYESMRELHELLGQFITPITSW